MADQGSEVHASRPVRVVDWTEPDVGDGGVDHLGMRVAGERAYGGLVDFTTTVTWRPRYLSYLCWSLQRARPDFGGTSDARRFDRRAWRDGLKHRDYVVTAASLAVARDAGRIAGSNKVTIALDAVRGDPAASVRVASDHLAGDTGSLAVYLGILRALGLVVTAKGIDVPTPAGAALAGAFQSCLRRTGAETAVDAADVAWGDLERLGETCGLSRLAVTASQVEEVAAEQRAIRERIVDPGWLSTGRGPDASRVLTIGMVLAIFRLYGRSVSLDELRATVLLDAANVDGVVRPLALPTVYDEVRARWRMYQAHAYATYALEALLGVVLAQAFEMTRDGDGAPYEALLDRVVGGIEKAAASLSEEGLREWPRRPLDALTAAVTPHVLAGLESPVSEPRLHAAITSRVRNGGAPDLDSWAHDASLLWLVASARLARLMSIAPRSWTGDDDARRLPPRVIADDLASSLAGGCTAGAFVRQTVRRRVVLQHRQNALRKLAADPRQFTAKLTLEQGMLTPLQRHQPGTSNPRFENAVLFLQDLGYLTADDPVQPTALGDGLLRSIAREGAS